MTAHRKHDEPPSVRQGLIGWVIGVCVVALIILAGVLFVTTGTLPPDYEYTQAQLLDASLGMAHDELIMLIISLVVVIQAAANFRFLRVLPHQRLFLCSFGAMVLSVIFTVGEGFLFPETLNYLEHLSYAASAVLLAVWCGRVFMGRKRGVS